MCFSAQASFATGAALVIAGATIARQARSPAQLPYALIPVLFGLQQLVEGGLWMTLPADTLAGGCLSTSLTHVYAVFSHMLWPVYVPLAVLLLEPVRWRRQALAGLVVAGALVAAQQLALQAGQPLVASIVDQHIAYDAPQWLPRTTMFVYLASTCAGSMLSSHRTVVWFGRASFVSAMLAWWLYQHWFISVWCFFAAGLSGLVALFFVQGRQRAGSH